MTGTQHTTAQFMCEHFSQVRLPDGSPGCEICSPRVTAEVRRVPESAVLFSGGWFEPTSGHFYGAANPSVSQSQ